MRLVAVFGLAVTACGPGGLGGGTATPPEALADQAAAPTPSAEPSPATAAPIDPPEPPEAAILQVGTPSGGGAAAADATGSSAGTVPDIDAVARAVAARMTAANQVNTAPHRNSMTHAAEVNVYQVTPGVFAYTSGMAVDTDGSDPDPDPDHLGRTTWPTTDGRWLGAHRVPYYVLGDQCPDRRPPCRWFAYREHGISALQFALVFYRGRVIGAVFGDTQGAPGGDPRELGEASVKAASMLGIPSSGITGGVEAGVTVVIFSGPTWAVTGTNASLSDNAQARVPEALARLSQALDS